MNQDKRIEAADRLENALLNSGKGVYVLRLYVSGQTARSVRAIENLKRLCEEFLKDRHEIEIIDVYERPEHLKEAQIIVIPTLIKELPLPVRKFIGDLSNQENLLVELNLRKNT